MTPHSGKRYVLLGFALGIGISLAFAFQLRDSTPVTPFRTTLVEYGPIHEEISASGKVVSSHEITISAAGSGHLVRVDVKEGDAIDRGQILAHLDDREAIGKVHQATNSVRRAREEVLEAKRTMDRLRLLYEAGGESRQAADDAEATWRTARAHVSSAQDELQLARLELENRDVKAPYSGVITSDIAKGGQWVDPGTALFMLVDPNRRELEVQVDASESVALSVGQRVVVTSEAFQNESWQEHVLHIASTTNRESKLNTVNVRVSSESVAPGLLIGQQVDVLFHTQHKARTPRILSTALISKDGKHLLGVIREGRIHLVQVKLGVSNMTHTEIHEGLPVGAQVILHEGRMLVEGDKAIAIGGTDHADDVVR